MDPDRFREAYARLQVLDDRLTHKLRPRSMGAARATLEKVEDRLRDLASYTIEIKEILNELFQAIASKGQPAEGQLPPEGQNAEDSPQTP